MALRQPTTLLASGSRLLSSRSPFICASCTRQTRPASTDASSTDASPTTDSVPPTTNTPNRRVPPPTPFVPDPATFLKLIGRSLSTHTSKFSSWEEMFTLSSDQLRARGLEPPRARKYFLRWRQKFRNGDYGVGGDLKYVTDGTAELRVCEVPSLPRKETSVGSVGAQAQEAGQEQEGKKVFASTTHTPGLTRLILNVPQGATTYVLGKGEKTADLKKPKGIKLKEGRMIVGQYVMPVKGSQGSAATITVTEGMWEHKRGHKVHGGERRRDETLHKMRVAENKKAKR